MPEVEISANSAQSFNRPVKRQLPLPKETSSGLVPTMNKQGFMFTELSRISQKFVNYSAVCDMPVVDLGCAYGVATIPALERGRCPVIAVDICQGHLKVLESRVPPQFRHKLQARIGDIREVLAFSDGEIGAIHASNILHFMTGKEIAQALENWFQWLEPGGKLFINTSSIFLLASRAVVEAYHQRVSAGYEWPGEVYNTNDYRQENMQENIDDFLHLFEKSQLEQVLVESGFYIEDSGYYCLGNIDVDDILVDMPEGEFLDERGAPKAWIGIVACKP